MPQVLKSASTKFDRECFLRCCVALYGKVNAESKKVEDVSVLMLIKVPEKLLEEVPIDEDDDRWGGCQLHYVPSNT